METCNKYTELTTIIEYRHVHIPVVLLRTFLIKIYNNKLQSSHKVRKLSKISPIKVFQGKIINAIQMFNISRLATFQ